MCRQKSQKFVFFNFASLLLSVFALNLFLAQSVSAATLQDYKRRIDSAISNNEELLSSIEENDMAREREIIVEIIKEIPATEKIEWPGGSIDTENGWLAAKLKDFTDGRDEETRRVILVEISERLMAISGAISDLEKAVAGERTLPLVLLSPNLDGFTLPVVAPLLVLTTDPGSAERTAGAGRWVVYRGPGPGFWNDASPDYAFAAATDALKRLVDFLDRHLGMAAAA